MASSLTEAEKAAKSVSPNLASEGELTEWGPQPWEGTWGVDGKPVTSFQILHADRIL